MIRFTIVYVLLLLTAAMNGQQTFWKKLNGPNSGVVNCIVSDRNGYLFVGTNKGIFRSVDHGETWIHTSASLGIVNAKSIDFKNNGDVFAACNEGVFMSADNGDNWSNMASITSPVSLRINSNDEIFIGTYAHPCSAKVYCSTDGGLIWESGNQGLQAEFVNDIYFCKNGSILAATAGSSSFCESCIGINLSTDSGMTWKLSNNGIKKGYFGEVCSGQAFAGNPKGEIFACTNKGIFISKDNGVSWQERNNGIHKNADEAESMTDITLAASDCIFAIGHSNAYMSTDNGESWTVNSGGLDKFDDFSSQYYVTFSNDGYVYAGGKFGQKIFRSVNPVLTAVPGIVKNVNFKLYQNYPNPFNNSTIISYSIPENCFVRIKVFDVLGKEVSLLVNDFKMAGEYKITFDAGNLSSGIYLYKLFTDEYSDSKKFIIVK